MTSIEKKKCCASCIQPLPKHEELEVTICYKQRDNTQKIETWMLCYKCFELVHDFGEMEAVYME